MKSNKNASAGLRVKKSILIASGQPNENPEKLPDDTPLSGMLPTDLAYKALADMLDDLVKEHNKDAGIKTDDVKNCGTVRDCINLIKQ